MPDPMNIEWGMNVITLLNTFAGVGGNTKLLDRDQFEITHVETLAKRCNYLEEFFPNDTVIKTDAYQYILDHILEYDIIKAPTLDFSAGVSVFTTKPSIDLDDAGTNDFDQSTNAVFDINEQDILKDERLRLDITSLPVNMSKFEVFLLGELN